MKDERGYTLILVLVMMVVIAILGLALSGMATNVNKQISKTEHQNKATDLAEMGITFYKTNINQMISPAKAAMDANKTNFCTEFIKLYTSKENNLKQLKTVENQNSYQIIIPSDMIKIDCSRPDEVALNFTSNGKTSQEKIVITSQIVISKASRTGNIAPKLSDYIVGDYYDNYRDFSSQSATHFPTPLNVNEKDHYIVNNSSVWFNSFRLKGNGNENGTFTIKNEAIFQSLDMNGHTRLTVLGDVIFMSKESIVKQTKKAEICIKGDIYYVENKTLKEFEDIENYLNNSCINSNSKWLIDEDDGIIVKY